MELEEMEVYRIIGAPPDLGLDGLRMPWLMTDPQRWPGDRTMPAVVSHLSAAHTVYRLGVASPDINHLTTAYPFTAPLLATQIHVDPALGSEDWDWVDGLPVTTIGRTIADVYTYGIDGDHLGRIIWDAIRSGSSARSLAAALDRVTAGLGRPVLEASLRDCSAPQHLADASDQLASGCE